jgi:hypothetical protein
MQRLLGGCFRESGQEAVEYWDPATYLLLLSLMQSFLGLTVGSCL